MKDFDALSWRAQHGDEHERIAAAQALGASGDPRALPILLQLLDTAENDAMRNAAAIGLRDLGDPRAVPALARHIAQPRNPENFGTLLYALEPLDARAAVVTVVQAMGNGKYEVLAMGLRVIAAFAGPPAPADVVRALGILRRLLARQDYEDW